MATLKEQLAAEKDKLRKAQFLIEQSEASLERSGKEPSELKEYAAAGAATGVS